MRSFLPQKEVVTMRSFSRSCLITVAVLVAVCAFTIPTYADSEGVSGCTNCNGFTFQSTLTPTDNHGDYSLSYTITNVSGKAADPYSWSLSLFNSSSNISSVSNLTMSNGDQRAYSVKGGHCNGAVGDALCLQPSGKAFLSQIKPGQSLTFNLDFTCLHCTELGSWIFKSAGVCAANWFANCYSVNTSGSTASVPEPSIWVLFALTLVAFGVVVRWGSRLRPLSSGMARYFAK
jgi:hypothetical protein